MTETSGWGRILAFTVAALLTPSVMFFAVGLANGMGLGGTLEATVAQFGTKRLNLGVTSLLGLIPCLVLALAAWLHRRFGGDQALRQAMILGGGVVLLLVLVWANLEYWPDYLPHRQAPSWPHGMELVIGPMFFAPVGVLGGMVVAWIAGRFGR